MNRRRFFATSLLSLPGTRAAGQMAHSPVSIGASDWPVREESAVFDLSGADGWFNTAPLGKRSLRGKVVLLSFWTYSCINSLRPLPYLKRWASQYGGDGLVVLGVHTPEFSFEKHRANVAWALREFNISFPVAMDNDYRIWRAFQNEYWPAFYVIDGNGNIRHRRFGEGQYEETERVIRALLRLSRTPGPEDLLAISPDSIEAPPGREIRTPETYIGYRRAERFNSPERVARDARRIYSAPARVNLNNWGLSGAWEIGAESGFLREAPGKIAFRFHSRDLHLVLGPSATGKTIPFQVTMDGAAPGKDAGTDSSGDGAGVVRAPRLYQIIRQKGQVRDRLFEIEFLDSGVRAFSFTFG